MTHILHQAKRFRGRPRAAAYTRVEKDLCPFGATQDDDGACLRVTYIQGVLVLLLQEAHTIFTPFHFAIVARAFIALIDDLLYYFPRHLFSLSRPSAWRRTMTL